MAFPGLVGLLGSVGQVGSLAYRGSRGSQAILVSPDTLESPGGPVNQAILASGLRAILASPGGRE